MGWEELLPFSLLVQVTSAIVNVPIDQLANLGYNIATFECYIIYLLLHRGCEVLSFLLSTGFY